MNSDTKYAIVGLLTLFLFVGALGFGAYLVGVGRKSAEPSRYSIFFGAFSLAGLQIDSPVTLRGIRVGRVEDLRFVEENIEEVHVTVALDPDTPVKTDTEAEVERNVVTGLAQISLTGSTQEAPLLRVVPSNQRYPVIKEGKNTLKELASNLPKLLAKFELIADEVSQLLGESNQDKFSKILTNLDRSSGQTSELLTRVSKVAQQLEKLGKTGERFINTTEQQLETFTKSSQMELKLLSIEAREMKNQLSDTLNEVNITARRLQNPKDLVLGSEYE